MTITYHHFTDDEGNRAFIEWDKGFHPDVRRLLICDETGHTIMDRVYLSEKSAKAAVKKYMINPVRMD